MNAPQPLLLPDGFILRSATKDDLNDITRIHVEGFTEEPYDNYCFPYRDRYPEDYFKWTRFEYENYIEQPQKFLVHVLVGSAEWGDRPIGLAVWNLAVLTPGIGQDPILVDRKDANRKRCEAFREATGKRFKTYFAKWADEQVNLATLVVHPNFRRRGAGTMLVNWGLHTAQEKGWPVTLCSSPMGRLLYEHLKFKKIATEVVQVDGEEETLESTVMVFEEGVILALRC